MRGRLNRGWSGVAFVGVFLAGLFPLGDLIGSFGDSDATFHVYFADAGKRTGALIGGFMLGLSALVFLWFFTHLQDCLAHDRRSSRVASAAGSMFAVVLLAASASFLTVPFARGFGAAYDEQSVLQSGEAVLPQLGYVLLAVFSMWTAALMILTVSLAARQAEQFPRWLTRIGFAAAAFVFLLGPSVVGILGFPVWVLAVSAHWFRSGRSRVEPAQETKPIGV